MTPTHPVVKQIVGEITLIDGEARLPADRFDHWASTLPTTHPTDATLYGHLVGAALIFARREAPAAAQLFVLGTLGEVQR